MKSLRNVICYSSLLLVACIFSFQAYGGDREADRKDAKKACLGKYVKMFSDCRAAELSDEQRDAINSVREKIEGQISPMKDALREKKDAFYVLLADSKSDRAAAQARLEEIIGAKMRLKSHKAAFKLEVLYGVASPEQRPALVECMKAHRDRHHRAKR